jgi:hypothetical protein
MVSFESFQAAFLAQLSADHFGGDPEEIEPGTLSAAAKELKNKRAHPLLSAPDFLISMYRLVQEHDRLVNEQPKIRSGTRDATPMLTKFLNARRSLSSIRRRLKVVQDNIGSFLDPGMWARLYAALDNFESDVHEREKSFVANLHPAERQPHHMKPKFENVLKPYDYSLATLRKKAPDQWLYENLYSALVLTPRQRRISAMTRYRIVAALLSAAGLTVKPITIKQHFQAKKRATTTKAVRNFPST